MFGGSSGFLWKACSKFLQGLMAAPAENPVLISLYHAYIILPLGAKYDRVRVDFLFQLDIGQRLT